jgi:GntR family galactonate operon transcriptional repressor
MSEADRVKAPAPGPFGEATARVPAARLGVAVVHDLVTIIVSGEVAPGDSLPPEERLAQHFGVSRTVIRESVKRIEEKGLVTVAPGRGTQVQPSTSWNMLDPVVLEVLVENDDSLGVLDDLAVVRSSLEGAMAAETAARRSDGDLEQIRRAYAHMEESISDEVRFSQADFEFHVLVMALSGNQLAGNITKTLFQRARESSRFTANQNEEAFRITLAEHHGVLQAIEAGDPVAADETMRHHIMDAWQRRRLPTRKHG